LLKDRRCRAITVAMGGADHVLVARQAILDHRLRVVGYELLYRAPHALGHADVVDAEQATSRVIAEVYTEIGLEKMVGAHPAFINVTREFLLTVRPLPLSPGRAVLELLEDQEPDEELLEVLRELRAKDYTIALDDFVYHEALDPLLELASIVKIDVLALEPDDVLAQLEVAKRRGLRAVAEKVEAHDDFERWREAGFELFQGYFYARPRTVHAQRVPARTIDALGALAELQSTGGDFDRLEQVIRRDVGLSYRLLRYVNSAFFAFASDIESVHDALVRLGARTVQQWATVLVLAGVPGTPHELLATALRRARMCELLAPAGDAGVADRCFTVGLFSVVDGLLDVPMDEALGSLPLSDAIKVALLGGDNAEGRLLRRVTTWELGEFDVGCDRAEALIAANESYRAALEWSDAVAASLA
jgi:EAL and modified HD-GYP domain-containing signal transduction protein